MKSGKNYLCNLLNIKVRIRTEVDTILLFLGAGASKPFDMPNMRELTDNIVNEFKKRYIDTSVLNIIKKRVEDFGFVPDIEAVLTCLDALSDPGIGIKNAGPFAALISDRRKANEITFGPKQEKCRNFSIEIRKIIRENCNFPPAEKEGKLVEVYDNLFDIFKIEQNNALDVYTTNYDLCFERYCAKRGRKLNNLSNDRNRVDSKLLQKKEFWNLYKLHGSSNWVITDDCVDGEIIITDMFVKSGDRTVDGEMKEEVMIYPTTEKYFLRDPYFSLLLNLRNDLISGISDKDSKLIVIIGYSFRDDAINSAFIDSLNKPAFKHKNIFLIDPHAKRIISENIPRLCKIIEPIDKRIEELNKNDLKRVDI